MVYDLLRFLPYLVVSGHAFEIDRFLRDEKGTK